MLIRIRLLDFAICRKCEVSMGKNIEFKNDIVSACVAEADASNFVWLAVRCDHGYSYPVLLALLLDILSDDVNIVACC